MGRFLFSFAVPTEEQISNISKIPEVDAKATDAQTTANSVQDQMDALTSAFATEEASTDA